MTPAEEEENLKDWKRRLDILFQEVTTLAHFDDVFWQVRAIYIANEELTSGDHTWANWIHRAYTVTMSIGLRRLFDGGKDTASFRILLDDMIRNHTLLTRERFLRAYNNNAAFDAVAGLGVDVVPKVYLSKEIRKKL